MSRQRSTNTGFTIVELLIVIVVIAILATISIVTFSGIQKRAQNASRSAQFSQVHRLIEIYRATYGTLPATPSGVDTTLCVGKNYPDGVCRNSNGVYAKADTDTSFSAELEKVGTIPSSGYLPVYINSSSYLVGPFIVRQATNADGFSLVVVIDSEDSDDCPENSSFTWNDPSSSAITCEIRYRYQ